MKFCKDCEHCLISSLGPSYAKCRAEAGRRMDIWMVSGSPIESARYCEAMRSDNDHGCGTDARYFMPFLPIED